MKRQSQDMAASYAQWPETVLKHGPNDHLDRLLLMHIEAFGGVDSSLLPILPLDGEPVLNRLNRLQSLGWLDADHLPTWPPGLTPVEVTDD